MNQAAELDGLALNISAVERETGLSKDVLRMWERRYGFPKPDRDENGERQYTPADTAKLRAIKRLMDVGMRPGKLMAHSLDQLNALADSRSVARRDQLAPALERDVLTLLQLHDAPGLQHTLANMLMKQGLHKFVLETVTPLNRAVGESWMRGELQVFEALETRPGEQYDYSNFGYNLLAHIIEQASGQSYADSSRRTSSRR